jgi:hypothetical protein
MRRLALGLKRLPLALFLPVVFSFMLIILLPQEMGIAHASGVVNVYDNAEVLDKGQVEKAASGFQYNLDLYTTSSFPGDAGELANFARKHFTSLNVGMVVMVIDTVHRHLAIVDNGKNVSITDTNYQDALNAFRKAIGKDDPDYTKATVAAIQSLQSAIGQNNWVEIGFWIIVALLVIVSLAASASSGGSGSGRSGGYRSRTSYTYYRSGGGGGGGGGGGVAGGF